MFQKSLLLFSIAALGAFATSHTHDSSIALTPHGPRDAAKVHPVPAGGEVKIVGDEIHVVNASGHVVDVTIYEPAAIDQFASGWTAYAQWINSAPNASPISFFNTTWTVPPAPTSNDNQLVYLFNSLVPPNGDGILQPVLQWGNSPAGGGPYWALASWYILGADTYHTPLTTTAVGQVLEGVITLTSQSPNGRYNYACEFAGVPASHITATNSVELTWATETLEAYNMVRITDYPPGQTVFSGIYLQRLADSPPIKWEAISDKENGIITTVNIDGSKNAKITITY